MIVANLFSGFRRSRFRYFFIELILGYTENGSFRDFEDLAFGIFSSSSSWVTQRMALFGISKISLSEFFSSSSSWVTQRMALFAISKISLSVFFHRAHLGLHREWFLWLRLPTIDSTLFIWYWLQFHPISLSFISFFKFYFILVILLLLITLLSFSYPVFLLVYQSIYYKSTAALPPLKKW